MKSVQEKQYAEFLRAQIDHFKGEIERFYTAHQIDRTKVKLSSDSISHALMLNKTTIGRLKSALLNKYIGGSHELNEPIEDFLKDLEAKKGPLPLVDYKVSTVGVTTSRRNSSLRKTFDVKVATALRNFEKQVVRLEEELFRTEKKDTTLETAKNLG